MWELLTKLGPLLKGGLKHVATGNAQAKLGIQSPALPSGLVRVGRFFFAADMIWIAVSWYTGFVNQRTAPGSGLTLVLPGSNTPIISSPDRPDKAIGDIFGDLGNSSGHGSGVTGAIGDIVGGALDLATGNIGGAAADARALFAGSNGAPPAATHGRTLVAISPAQLGTPGTAVGGSLWTAPSGQKQLPPYSAAVYRSLVPVASSIAQQYGMHITSGYRPGSGGSLHASGLAFDMVGSMPQMRRAAAWAANYPGQFQEIFVHDEGSGMHLHIGLYPDAAAQFYAKSQRYAKAQPQRSH